MKLTIKKASVILPCTEEAVLGLPYKHRNKTIPLIHIGVDIADFPKTDKDYEKRINEDRGIRILTGGRLLYWKGFGCGSFEKTLL